MEKNMYNAGASSFSTQRPVERPVATMPAYQAPNTVERPVMQSYQLPKQVERPVMQSYQPLKPVERPVAIMPAQNTNMTNTNTNSNNIMNSIDIDTTINYNDFDNNFNMGGYPNYAAVNTVENTYKKCPSEMDRRQMAMKIKEINFTVIELALYLDTHPDDQRALCMHRDACKALKDLKDKYQKVYGPLSIYCPCNKWRWLEEPWAW